MQPHKCRHLRRWLVSLSCAWLVLLSIVGLMNCLRHPSDHPFGIYERYIQLLIPQSGLAGALQVICIRAVCSRARLDPVETRTSNTNRMPVSRPPDPQDVQEL